MTSLLPRKPLLFPPHSLAPQLCLASQDIRHTFVKFQFSQALQNILEEL